jgi:hypothetical protein
MPSGRSLVAQGAGYATRTDAVAPTGSPGHTGLCSHPFLLYLHVPFMAQN